MTTKELVKRIKDELRYIEKEDLTKAELNILKVIEREFPNE